MNHYFGYIRVSTAKQGLHGSSLQEQKSAIERYAARHQLTIIAWYEERETAAKQGRQMFTRMLAELDQGKARGVVMHKIDRSARNLKDWSNLGELFDRGIDIRFAHDDLDMKSRGGRLSADIQAVVAADFIRNLTEEVKKGLYGRLNQGIYPFRAPVGYRDTGSGIIKEVDAVQAPLVRQTFELYAQGDINFRTLGQEMYRRGLRNRDGGRVSRSGLTIMLHNAFYIGLIRIRATGQTYDGKHAPIIKKALFDRVQDVLHGKRIGKPWKNDFLFRRLVKCVHCGNSLIGERQKGRYVYYRCHGEACGVCLSEKRIDSEVRQLLGLLRLSSRDVRDIRDEIEDIRQDDKKDLEDRISSIQMQIRKCDERLSRLTNALLDALIDSDTFEAHKVALLQQKRGLLDQLQEPGNLPSVADRVSSYVELADMAYLSYEKGIPAEIRDLLNSLMSNFSGEGKNPVITLKSPFQEIVNYRIRDESADTRDRPRTRVSRLLSILMNVAKVEHAQARSAANDNGSQSDIRRAA